MSAIDVMDRRNWLQRLIHVRSGRFHDIRRSGGDAEHQFSSHDMLVLLCVVYALSACWFGFSS